MSILVLKKQTCLYCGNNPTSHGSARVDAVIVMTLGGLFKSFERIPGSKIVLRFSEYILDRLWDLAVFLMIIRFTGGASAVSNDRARVLYDEVIKRGHLMETATIFSRSLDVYRITFKNGKELVFSGLPRPDIKDDTSANWIDDKALLKRRLADAQVCVSEGSCFSSFTEAEAYFKAMNRPAIVKPRFGSRGRHTTTHITKDEDFKEAFTIAKQLGHYVMLEEHLVGSVYRATMIDGKLAGVLAGDPPRVTGDGMHTIAKLIEQKNDTRHERVCAYKITELTHLFLARQGYTLDTILEKEKTIDLSEKIGLSYGGNAREVTPSVHPKLRDALERAARAVDDPIIGFDFITPDVSADPDTVRWGIIECNAVPFINLHHDPLEGEPINVAGIFLEYIERELLLRSNV